MRLRIGGLSPVPVLTVRLSLLVSVASIVIPPVTLGVSVLRVPTGWEVLGVWKSQIGWKVSVVDEAEEESFSVVNNAEDESLSWMTVG